MELTLTVLMKAIMLHWNAPAPPPSFHVTITLAGYSNLTGSHFFRVRSIFIFQAECVHMYMDFFKPNFSLSVVNPLVLLCGFLLYRKRDCFPPSPTTKKSGLFRFYGSKSNRTVNNESLPFTWHLKEFFPDGFKYNWISNVHLRKRVQWSRALMNIFHINEDMFVRYRSVLLIVLYLSGWSQTSTGGRQIVPVALMMSLHVPSPTHWEVLTQLEDG